ncbi:MAG: hypothetical protein HY770_06220 [Chitinivibrionia bacterium]|nr:hypothetical protein [Chitinivibrionia bacterium]
MKKWHMGGLAVLFVLLAAVVLAAPPDPYTTDSQGIQGSMGERSQQGGPPSDGSRGSSRGERRGPPPEAYAACVGKTAGTISQFTDPRGETLTGTCEEESGRMVLRPDKNKGNRQKQAREGAGRSNTVQ